MKNLILVGLMLLTTLTANAQASSTFIFGGTGGNFGAIGGGGNTSNVGIGTNLPNYKLTVLTTNPVDNGIGIENQSDMAAMLRLYANSAGSRSWGVASLGTGNGGTANGKFGIVDLNTQTYRLIIDTIGNIGIGTFNPTEKLSIQTATNKYGLLHTNGTVNVGSYISSNCGWYGTKSNHALKLFTNDGAATICLLPNGKVTVGMLDADTTGGKINAAYKLFVKGGIHTDKLLVRAYTAWADYVFHPSYSLKGLDEVENYIQENKHLPGIPSAQEIEDNGIDIPAMQTLQMEKIEELTLYVIQLKKEIDQLKNQNASPLITNSKN